MNDRRIILQARRLAMRKRLIPSCTRCKSRKIKCSGFRPCSGCQYLSIGSCVQPVPKEASQPLQQSAMGILSVEDVICASKVQASSFRHVKACDFQGWMGPSAVKISSSTKVSGHNRIAPILLYSNPAADLRFENSSNHICWYRRLIFKTRIAPKMFPFIPRRMSPIFARPRH